MLKLLKLFRYLRAKEWLFCLFSLVFVCAQVVIELMIPDYMSEITTLIETPGSAMGDVWSAGGMMLLCAFGSLVSSIAVCFFASRIAANFSKRLRKEMFYKVESFTLEEINAFSTASLITRSTNDVVQVQMLVVLSLQVVVKAPLMAVWAIMKIAGKAWQWSLATGIAVVLLVAILSVAVVRTFPRFKRIQWLQDSLNQSARENLTGIRVVHAYNAEKYQEKKFEKVNTELLNNSLFANRTMTILSPFMSLVMNCLNMSIYWIGAVLISSVAAGGATGIAARVDIFADMIVFMSYAMQVIMSFIMIVMVIIIAPRALEAAKRISEVLAAQPKVVSGTVTDSGDISGTVEFKNVSFTYPGGSGNVLSNVSFKADKGETVAFIGSTGSGKTTLMNLIPRFYDVSEGSLKVNGTDVRNYNVDELRKLIGVVPQKAALVSGTVRDNVKWGKPDATDEEIIEALKTAQALDFVNEKDGLDSKILQGGKNLSGGQRQRMEIARVLAQDPTIIILDEATANVDPENEKELMDAIQELTQEKTVIMIAHRLKTVRHADQILVVDKGQIVQRGTHEELMAQDGIYRHFINDRERAVGWKL